MLTPGMLMVILLLCTIVSLYMLYRQASLQPFGGPGIIAFIFLLAMVVLIPVLGVEQPSPANGQQSSLEVKEG